MKTRTYLFLAVVVAGVLLAAFRKRQGLDGTFPALLGQKLDRYNRELPAEEIYLQTDKPFYKPGEDIWLRAFVVDGMTHKPTGVSNIIYVELVNPKGGVEKQLTLPVTEGGAGGDFTLEESAPGGLYKVRAYSKWMKNFGEDVFFEKEIQVQKVLTPRLLLKFDFERKAYGPSDRVVADFEVKDLQNNPLPNQPVTFYVQLAGQAYYQGTATTNREGKAALQFALPDTLRSPDGLLNIVVPFEGKSESVSRAVPIVLNRIDLQFFPEGGHLVQHVPGRVAFKAVNESGKPADVEGEVLDEKGEVVQTFRSYHQGMGAFRFQPGGAAYQVQITNPKGVATRYPLPAAMPKGFALSVDTVTDKHLRVSFYSPVDKEVSLVAQVRGQLYFSQQVAARTGRNEVEVPLDKFPMGVAQLTLFDHNGVPRCERLAFVNRHRQLTVRVRSDKPQYGPREPVELTVETLDEDSLPVPATLALAVADDKLLSFADYKGEDILSYLLVSSDLKGKVEEPYFYFKRDEPKAALALEYLLMTQGWRRFTWKQVLAGNHRVAHLPEKTGTVTGRVLNAKTKGPQNATVTLFELGGNRRTARLQTLPDGSFTFLHVEPSVPVQLFAQAPLVKHENVQIVLDGQSSYTNLSEGRIARQAEREVVFDKVIIEEPAAARLEEKAVAVEEETAIVANNNVALAADVQALSEVVVIGYGAQEKRNLTGSVAVVEPTDLLVGMPRPTVAQALQGRVAGVQVTVQNGTPGGGANLRIRGANSIIGNGEPLYVVDGVPVEGGLNGAFSPVGFLTPGEIASIVVVKSPEAASLYGSLGANGAVVITTKKGDYHAGANQSPRTPITSVYLQPRPFSVAREFYAPVYDVKTPVRERTDFRSTIYWNPCVQTDANGTAKVRFYNSDEVTAFRATAEGIAVSGLAGRGECVYSTQLPLALDVKIPPYLTFEDRVQLPVFLKNNTATTLAGKLTIELPAALQAVGVPGTTLSLRPGEAQTVYVPCTVLPVAGKGKVRVAFSSEAYADATELEVEVQPKGFPVQASLSGHELDKSFAFRINEPVRGSVNATFTAYPDVIGDLMAGIESILQEPYGCFEQTSASTYPNVLALQYLNETGQASPEIQARALDLIRKGYKRLVSFETAENGYEWFGRTPAHEGLTAYGLTEFVEMKKVYSGVNEAMIRRTAEWLLKRRDGRGGFKLSREALDGFGGASREVTNAYLVYSLAEAGYSDIHKEYEAALKEAWSSKDAYRQALLASASFKLKRTEEGQKLVKELTAEVQQKGVEKLVMDHSIVRSGGKSLWVETASLIVLALLKSPQPDPAALQKLIGFLVGSRSYGGFGSTQATILALQAVTGFTRFSKRTDEGGKIELYLNNQLIAEKQYEKGSRGEITIPALEKHLGPGNQQFRVVFAGTKEPLPYSLNTSWSAYTPSANPGCKVDLETTLAGATVGVGKTLRLTTTLKNRTGQGQPMTVALVGIPSGLSPQPWQLKELQERGVFDFYEVRKNYVVVYYRQLAPKAVHTIHLDLKAEVPGAYEAPASTAYLYYTSEFKDWEGGERVEVLR